MTSSESTPPAPAQSRVAKDWVQVLARYREPSTRRSLFELAVTLVPFLLLWALAWAALSVSYLLAVAIAALNAFLPASLNAISDESTSWYDPS